MDNNTTEKQNRFQDNYLLQAWLCICLAFLFGIALAGVQASLGPKILANKINETKEKVPEVLIGAEKAAQMAAEGQNFDVEMRNIEVKKRGGMKRYTVYGAKYPDGTPAGWVTKTGGQGYADRIELLLGLDPTAQIITGVFILEQKETPGLGNKISMPEWRNQFMQKRTDRRLVVVKGGAKAENQINAVSGATISSVSVTNIINKAVSDLKQPLSTSIEMEKE